MPLTLPNWILTDPHIQNGQHILENLGDLKPTLVDRYERWASRNPEEAVRARAAAEQAANLKQPDEYRDVARYPAQDESGWQAQEAARRDSGRRREEERRRDEYRYRPPVDQGTPDQPIRLQIDTRTRKHEDAVAAARRAASSSSGEHHRQERTPESTTPVSGEDRRRDQDDLWRREEEDAARRRPREQQGILRRQQEAEVASRVARRTYSTPTAHVAGPSTLTPQRSIIEEPAHEDAIPLSMPLESPTRFALS